MARPNGYEVWRGPSLIDGVEIVLIMTGLRAGSSNSKTGGMVQTYILLVEHAPVYALKAGLDGSICGTCPRRSVASGGDGACYVTVWQGPRSVYDAWQRGRYPKATPAEARTYLEATGRKLRLGAYGDPGAVPLEVWRVLCDGLPAGHTGYTHRWADTGAGLAGLCMASTDSIAETEAAWEAGFATFRVSAPGDTLRMVGEARCPASAEAGKRTTCEACPMRCDGAARPGNRGRVIQAHGAAKNRVK